MLDKLSNTISIKSELYKIINHKLYIQDPLCCDCISRMYKLPKMKNIEDHIKNLSDYKDYKNNNPLFKTSVNSTTLSGNEITSFCDDEILIYKHSGKHWCFHMSELASIFKIKKIHGQIQKYQIIYS